MLSRGSAAAVKAKGSQVALLTAILARGCWHWDSLGQTPVLLRALRNISARRSSIFVMRRLPCILHACLCGRLCCCWLCRCWLGFGCCRVGLRGCRGGCRMLHNEFGRGDSRVCWRFSCCAVTCMTTFSYRACTPPPVDAMPTAPHISVVKA